MPEGNSQDPRAEAFGYICRRCLNCCHHKHIQLNPYEVARLARNRGVSTTALRRDFTVDGAGVALAQNEDGACIFLTAEGCGVHPDRPLVCRLYPLGRHVSWDGVERFSHLEPHPRSAGERTRQGTIARFLDEQGAEPFMRAADDYLAWINQVLEDAPEAAEFLRDKRVAPLPPEEFDLLDMDAAIAAHGGDKPPEDVEARRSLHLAILYAQLSTQEEDHHEQ
jgi:Fe-S-cluster containining protein